MIKSLCVIAAIFLFAPSIAFYPASPAAALSADLAKKCRDMAIKSHPPPIPPGGKAYAEAERAFFSECVSKNGDMTVEPPKNPSTPENK
jgi:hypothetical protein